MMFCLIFIQENSGEPGPNGPDGPPGVNGPTGNDGQGHPGHTVAPGESELHQRRKGQTTMVVVEDTNDW